MGCEYKIYGSVMLQRSPEVEAILEALRERLDDAVEVEELDENTIDLTLNFDDSTTVHTPSAMDDLFKQMEPFVIGAGSFDIETSGANWTEYLGRPEEVTKLRSASALRLIEEHIDLLTAADRAKLGAAGRRNHRRRRHYHCPEHAPHRVRCPRRAGDVYGRSHPGA
jgi:hypothetical protein